MEDDVTFMHRLAELYHEKKGDIAATEEMYETIIERYEDIDYEVNRAKTALGKLHGVS